MLNMKFEVYKVKREIERFGRLFDVYKLGKNEYGESIGEPNKVCSFSGLYHEVNEKSELRVGSFVRYRTELKPMILALYDDVKTLKVDDYIMLNNKKFKVVGLNDIYQNNIVCDISLDVVDNGS